MQKVSIFLSILFLFFSTSVLSQNITQNIRGTIVDKISKSPIIGASVTILKPLKGNRTNARGEFEIKSIGIGRISIKITSVGYQPIFLNNLELTSTKELILNLEMEEKVKMMKKVVIRRKRRKDKTLNKMVMVSGRTFSIEETSRFAGSRNDVARMAQNFAGVQASDDSRNDIIVRGNSPIGVLYRLEGIDIPNPNHFAASGTTGGPISMLNNNILASSDFLTSAFPAEYMNATSGVFDLNLRKGNNREYEFLGQIGFNGLEINTEGPISKKKGSSFIVGYRYSTLAVFSALGMDFGTGTAVPYYQDGSFKLHFPNKKGSTTLFGIGGLSNVKIWESENSGNNLYTGNKEDLNYKTNTGLVGLSRSFLLSKKSFAKTTIAYRANSTITKLDTFTTDPKIDKAPLYRDHSVQGALSLHSFFQTKFSTQLNMKAGIFIDRNFFRLNDSLFNSSLNKFITLTDYKGALWNIKPYVQGQYKFTDQLTATLGLSSIYFAYNKTLSIEPRAGLRYNTSPKSSISLGYGLHSNLAPYSTYFSKIETSPNVYSNTNKNLGLTKAHHFVIAYDRNLAKNTRLKAEIYYQSLFNVPISNSVNTFSLINQGAGFGVAIQDNMVNKGKGTNYGLELTVEQFMTKGFYYLLTGSYYKSTYTPSDGKVYPTAFDGRYAANIIGGKEFFIKEVTLKKRNIVRRLSATIDVKGMMNGGKRYTPIDLAASKLAGEAVYDFSNNFGSIYKSYNRFDLRLAIKMQSKKTSHEWAMDMQNVMNRKNIFAVTYDKNNASLKETYQTGFFPVMQYRFRF